MRILWSSNSPFVSSGYGQQTAIACKRLKEMGHDVSIFAFYGLQGARTDWGDIPIYPNNPSDWGLTHAPIFYDDFKADVYISLVDVWVLNGLDGKIKHVPWMPIDHDPAPGMVIQTLKQSLGLVKPIAMSRFGQKQLEKHGIESYYIPHTVNTELFKPDEETRKFAREKYQWQDKFVIGTVGTNHTERKNWTTGMKAVSMFAKKHPGEVVYYMHTNPNDTRGISLAAFTDTKGIRHNGLKEALDLNDICKFPSQAEINIGIPQETMARMYNVLDVFLLPSKGEGFGVPLIEAMACGTPTITTNCTAQPEIVGNTGWLIKDLIPEWTLQNSWQFNSRPEEIVELLEKAYKAKKNGSIVQKQQASRDKAMEYDEEKVYRDYWPPVLADIEKKIKEPRNMEGVQTWRLPLIPPSCLPRKVLDIGCGVTQPYKKFLEHLGDYVGIDTKEAPGVVKMDAHNLKFSDGEFGFVWMSEVLEHVDNPEQVLAEAKRVGKHGVCIFSTPQNQYFKLDPDHKVVKIPHQIANTGDGILIW
jgi:glycosyltransferase involved in cell wall biosynthesis